MPQPPATRFCVLIPVKQSAHAKSRLASLGEDARRSLVAAFASDTVRAATGSALVSAVMVVTDDHVLAAGLSRPGVHVVPDGVSGDLNGTLLQAAAEAHRRWPELGVVALCADLPALRPADLTQALEVATATASASAFVPDLSGEGTTMLVARTVEDFTPRFGPRSREAHLAEGAHEITGVDVPTLRRDVDTPDDLEDALELGVGISTSSVAARLRL